MLLVVGCCLLFVVCCLLFGCLFGVLGWKVAVLGVLSDARDADSGLVWGVSLVSWGGMPGIAEGCVFCYSENLKNGTPSAVPGPFS